MEIKASSSIIQSGRRHSRESGLHGSASTRRSKNYTTIPLPRLKQAFPEFLGYQTL
jgi:hypothetical protein